VNGEAAEEVMSDSILEQIKASRDLKTAILADAGLIDSIRTVAVRIVEAFREGRKVLIAGNGGSAADAQHLAAELAGRLAIDRPGLPAVALTINAAVLTAIGNDFGYDAVFSRQVEGMGAPGDVFVGISTSGRSSNILKALAAARTKRLVTVGLTGGTGEMAPLCDYCIAVPSGETARIQEAHIMIGHVICSVVEDSLFGKQG
jgi:D-sedoheptulose 7-phosphate isomerase